MDPLELAEQEVDRLFDEYKEVREAISRENVGVGVARWKGRHGVCKYNKSLPKQRFGERMSSLPTEHGNHAIVINEKLLEDAGKSDFIDTTRHELAHAIIYAIHGVGQGHNHFWKAMASKLGADPSACHHRRDRSDEYNYHVTCANCGNSIGRTKRSKTVKQPFHYKCGDCGKQALSSHDDGNKRCNNEARH